MNTCVLCFSRRNALQWMIRSRSRWYSVRMSDGGSARTRPRLSKLRAAAGASSRSRSSSRNRTTSCRRIAAIVRHSMRWRPDCGMAVLEGSENRQESNRRHDGDVFERPKIEQIGIAGNDVICVAGHRRLEKPIVGLVSYLSEPWRRPHPEGRSLDDREKIKHLVTGPTDVSV